MEIEATIMYRHSHALQVLAIIIIMLTQCTSILKIPCSRISEHHPGKLLELLKAGPHCPLRSLPFHSARGLDVNYLSANQVYTGFPDTIDGRHLGAVVELLLYLPETRVQS